MNLSLILLPVIALAYPLYRNIRKGFRMLMARFKTSYRLISLVDSIFDWIKRNNQFVAYIFFGLLFLVITYLQEKNNTPIYDIENKSLIEILGFIIAIFSLYGIYIGFLQYITDHNEGNMFLGKSKVNYLINRSIWYNITQSRFFIASLMIAAFIPLNLRLDILLSQTGLDQYKLQLAYIWQTTIVLLLLIYLFLLKMSLETIYITLLMKTGSDSGLQAIMKREIQETYLRAFWKSYNIPDYWSKIVENMLESDLEKLERHEIDEYISLAFKGVHQEFLFNDKEKVWMEKNTENLSSFYIRHLLRKWDFLEKRIDDISYPVWRNLLNDDIQHIKFFERKLGKRLIVQKSIGPINKYATEYLFDQVIKKSNTNLQDIIVDAENSTKRLYIWDIEDIDESKKYELALYNYEWKEILSNYHSLQSEAKLPKLKKRLEREYDSSGLSVINSWDPNNSDLYSKACFEFLCGYYGRIGVNIETTNYLKSLILSMNDEYLVAYSLYQMLYTDGSDWKPNFSFFDSILQNTLPSYDEDKYQYYYDFSKNIILSTDISHRISEDFLGVLWATRKDAISSLHDWFTSFGQRHRSTAFRLLYIQNLFTSKYKQRGLSRVNLSQNNTHENLDLAVSICAEYLQLLAHDTKIKKELGLDSTIESLLLVKHFDFKSLLRNLSIKSILHLEYMLKYSSSFFERLSDYQKVFFESVEVNYDNKKRYLIGTEMMHFLVLKTVDLTYEEYFRNPKLMQMLKYEIKNYLVKHDLDIPDYTDFLYKELKNDASIKISAIEKRMIMESLHHMFSTSKNGIV